MKSLVLILGFLSLTACSSLITRGDLQDCQKECKSKGTCMTHVSKHEGKMDCECGLTAEEKAEVDKEINDVEVEMDKIEEEVNPLSVEVPATEEEIVPVPAEKMEPALEQSPVENSPVEDSLQSTPEIKMDQESKPETPSTPEK